MLTPPGHVNHVVWPMTAVGGDIRERWEVYRRGDGPCTPSGGTRSRLWHWDGSSLVAGKAKRIANPLGGNPGNPATSAEGYFKTPSGNIICFFSTGPDALGCAESAPGSSLAYPRITATTAAPYTTELPCPAPAGRAFRAARATPARSSGTTSTRAH